ncbi:unnamed protein product [Prunus brigantina]
MKKSLPSNAKISKEAKETVQECVSEFISFVTGKASYKCQREKRKTINGDDLPWAMTTTSRSTEAQGGAAAPPLAGNFHTLEDLQIQPAYVQTFQGPPHGIQDACSSQRMEVDDLGMIVMIAGMLATTEEMVNSQGSILFPTGKREYWDILISSR